MKFDTREDAIHFCEKQGWHYFVQEPHKARIPPKSYAANSSTRPASCAFITPSKQRAADMRVRTGELYVGDVGAGDLWVMDGRSLHRVNM